MRKGIYATVAVIVLLAVFLRTVSFSYIGLDDAAYTFRNPFVAGGLTASNIIEAFSNIRHGGIWMPVTYISYMIDFSVSGLAGIPVVGWMHFVNMLLHMANFLLLCRFLQVCFGGDCGSRPLSRATVLLAAFLWAIHPLRAEPVAWIAARKELLWSLFALFGMTCWIRSRQWLTVVFCVLACLSKPTAMCVPFLLLMILWWMGRDSAPAPASHVNRSMLRNSRLAMMVLFAVAAATAAIAAYSQTHVAGQDAASLYTAPLANRLVNALSALGFYVRATLLPIGLHVDCRTVDAILPLGGVVNLTVLAAVSIAAFAFLLQRRRTHRARALFLLSAGWAFASILPTLGLLGSFGVEAHADRFAYFPSMALAFLAAWAFAKTPLSTTLRSISVVAVLLLASVTFVQLGYWRDDDTAHRRALACDPAHPRALVHVADATCSRKRNFDAGISLYRRALSFSGTVPKGCFDGADVTNRLAYALATRGRYADFQEVKQLGSGVLRNFRNDRRGMMLDALGSAFMYEGDMKRAALLFKASIDAPDRFWPKASTQRKLEACR